jgi:hypothetical protein
LPSTVTADDLMTGILAGLALRGERLIDIGDTRFDEAVAAAYDELVRTAGEDLDIDFEVIPDPVHGDSAVVQDALTVAIESRLAGRVNPSFRRVRVTADDAWATILLSELPGGPELYGRLTLTFLQRYKSQAELPV